MSAAEDTVVHDETLHGCQVTTVEVRTKQAAAQLGRAAGRYITMQMKPQSEPHDLIGCEGECLAALLSRVFTPHFPEKTAGLRPGKPQTPRRLPRAGGCPHPSARPYLSAWLRRERLS